MATSRKRSLRSEHETASNFTQPGATDTNTANGSTNRAVRRKLRSRRSRKSCQKILNEAEKLLHSTEDNCESDRDPGPGATRSKRVRPDAAVGEAGSKAEAGYKVETILPCHQEIALPAGSSAWQANAEQGPTMKTPSPPQTASRLCAALFTNASDAESADQGEAAYAHGKVGMRRQPMLSRFAASSATSSPDRPSSGQRMPVHEAFVGTTQPEEQAAGHAPAESQNLAQPLLTDSFEAVPQSLEASLQEDRAAEFPQPDLPPAAVPTEQTFLPVAAAGEGPASAQGTPAAPSPQPSDAGAVAFVAYPTPTQDILMEAFNAVMSHDSPASEQPEQAAGQAAQLERTITLTDWGTRPADMPPTNWASPATVPQTLPEAPAQQDPELELEVEMDIKMDMEMEVDSPEEMASDILPGAPPVPAGHFFQATANASVTPSLTPSPFGSPTPSPFACPLPTLPQTSALDTNPIDTEMTQDASGEDINGEVNEEMLPAYDISAEEHAAQQRLASAQSEVEEELARLRKLRQEAAQIAADNNAARQQAGILSGQLASLRTETEAAQRSRDAAKTAEASAIKIAQEAVQRAQQLNTQIQQGHTVVKRLRAEALAAQADAEHSRAACAQQCKELEAEQACIEAQKMAMAAEVEATKAILETRAQELNEREALVDEQSAHLNKLTGDLQQRMAASEEVRATQEAELTSWQAELQEKEARHAEAAKMAQECSQDLKKLAADLQKSERKVKKERMAHASEMEALEDRVAELESMLAAARRSQWTPGLSVTGRQNQERQMLARIANLERLVQEAKQSRDALSAAHESRTLALQVQVAELEALLPAARSSSSCSSQTHIAAAHSSGSEVPNGPKAPSKGDVPMPIHIHAACSASQAMAPCASNACAGEQVVSTTVDGVAGVARAGAGLVARSVGFFWPFGRR